MKSRTARESAALAARLIAVEGYTWRAAFAEARVKDVGAVRRGVIDHEDLQAVHPARGNLDGEQALLQEIFDVVIDDDNGEDNFLSLHNILFIHRRLYDNIICVHWKFMFVRRHTSQNVAK